MKKLLALYLLALVVWLVSPVTGQDVSVSILPLALIAGAATLAGNVAKGFIAKGQHNKYARELGKLEKTMPQGMNNAERIVNNMASNGLIGYGQMRDRERSTIPSSINAYKDIVDNPTALLQAAQTAESRVNSRLTDLSIEDAIAKATNLERVIGFQQNKGDIQMNIENFNNEKRMAIMKERMMGNKELMGGITQGITGGFDVLAGMQNLLTAGAK